MRKALHIYLYLMKKLTLPGLIFICCLTASAQNPICPEGVYFADPSARVFDGTLYLYGSTDESCDYYCSWHHDVLSTANMNEWKIYRDVFESLGPNDGVHYNNSLLFAPDCAERDGMYFLYYCQPDPENAEGVAVSESPGGPFTCAQPLSTGEHNEIDPAVFIDDDGTAYYLWGQFSLKMAKLKPGMTDIDLSTVKDSILTEADHFFHEGAYMTKRKGTYYLVYADISREDKPTCIGYATSRNPMGPYDYRGVIIDNEGCNPGNWNNHGSIIEFNNQWYVFYHRSTHGCKTMRKACAERISFLDDGSIPEVEMTSQGPGEPLEAKNRTDASRACLLHGNVRIMEENPGNEILGSFRNGDAAIFKFIDFNTDVSSVRMRIKTSKGGRIVLSAGKPWEKRIAEYRTGPGSPEGDWQLIEFPVREIEGIHALWIQCYGEEGDLLDIDWFQFY